MMCPYCEGRLEIVRLETEQETGARYFCLGKCRRYLNEDYSETLHKATNPLQQAFDAYVDAFIAYHNFKADLERGVNV